MIRLNGTRVEPKYFGDGTLDIKIDPSIPLPGKKNRIDWLFDNNEEIVVLWFLASHLRSKCAQDVDLYMPYVPYARKDRAHREKDVFSLKYFADIINRLNFSNVYVLDPHSTVCEALIDRVRIISPKENIERVLGIIGDNAVMFYPDEGAVKRYSDMTDLPFVYGMKVRNKETRVIESFEICGWDEGMAGSDILMVDDICASGKTLLTAARKLKELGARKIYVYVSHCENAAKESPLLGEIEALYTTDSVFRGENGKIKII